MPKAIYATQREAKIVPRIVGALTTTMMRQKAVVSSEGLRSHLEPR
jgi:hypothetical protein